MRSLATSLVLRLTENRAISSEKGGFKLNSRNRFAEQLDYPLPVNRYKSATIRDAESSVPVDNFSLLNPDPILGSENKD